jgi:hypothetical protein
MAIPRGVYRDARRRRYQRKSQPAVGIRLLSNAQAGLLRSIEAVLRRHLGREPSYPSRRCRESLSHASVMRGRNTLTVD